MIEDSVTQHFYETLQQYVAYAYSNEELDSNGLDVAQQLLGIMDDGFYVIDFYQRQFVYVTPQLLLLCGHDPDDALKQGYDFYSQVVYKEDMPLLIEIHQVSIELLFTMETIEKLKCIKFNIRLFNDGQLLMVDHKIAPLQLTREGKVRLAACRVTHAVARTPGNLKAYYKDDTVHEYSFESKIWKPVCQIQLSQMEKNVLRLMQQGKERREIATLLHISEHTVKNHKNNIFNKLGVKNGIEAINVAVNNQLI